MTEPSTDWWACGWCETRNGLSERVCRICGRPEESAVAHIQAFLSERLAGRDSVDFGELAVLVHELLQTQSAAARAVNTEVGRELVVLEAALCDAAQEADQQRSELDGPGESGERR